MNPLKKDYEKAIKDFLSISIDYEDPEFFSEPKRARYQEFLYKIIKGGTYDKMINLIEIEFHTSNEKAKFMKSEFIESLFISFYGKPVPLNPRLFPNADAYYNQMMSPGFAFLYLNYLKTGKIHFPLTEQEKSQIKKVQNNTQLNSGCILFFSIVLVAAITLLILFD